MELTDRHRKLLAFIERQRQDKGFAPSWREICEEFGWKSTGAASFHVARLRAAGLVDMISNGSRTLHLTAKGFRALEGGA